jgi:hemerythrin-like domain-containing protein
MTETKTALIEGFKAEHAQLGAGLAALTGAMDRLQRGGDTAGVPQLRETEAFFRQVLVPHAEWEEITFYPGVGDLVRRHGDVNATMLIDHREILKRISEFVRLAGEIETGNIDPALVDRARILAYQIRALVEVHCLKEEEVYVSLLRRYLSDAEVVHALAVGDQMGHD